MYLYNALRLPASYSANVSALRCVACAIAYMTTATATCCCCYYAVRHGNIILSEQEEQDMQHAQDSFKYRGTHKGTVKYALRACGRWAKEWFVEKLLAGTEL
jgi:hypothetical protein